MDENPEKLARTWVRVYERDTRGIIVYVEYDHAPSGYHRDILELLDDGTFIADLENKKDGRIHVMYGAWKVSPDDEVLLLKLDESAEPVRWNWAVVGELLLLSEVEE